MERSMIYTLAYSPQSTYLTTYRILLHYLYSHNMYQYVYLIYVNGTHC